MKKITLAFLGFLFSIATFAQTYTTGTMVLIDDGDIFYSAKIDVTSSLVTLTLNGPDGRFLGFGFGVQSMTYGGDVVMFLDDTDTPEHVFALTDRTFQGIGVPPILDNNQDWTIVSNDLNAGQRTVVATRALNTGHDGDYVFSTSDTSIDYVFSVGFGYDLNYHGTNRGISMQSITLSQDEFAINDFKIAPNPAKSKFTLSLPNADNNAKLEVFDVLGKKLLTKNLNKITSTMDVSKWNSGVYLIRVITDNGTQTKRFIKQ
ncbi:MAG: T9SS type A sorting domain-containing protein [Gelidibacter sp.]|nr:T9SS type A sorting domain-containing protein [Gelidibacter sp.]